MLDVIRIYVAYAYLKVYIKTMNIDKSNNNITIVITNIYNNSNNNFKLSKVILWNSYQ